MNDDQDQSTDSIRREAVRGSKMFVGALLGGLVAFSVFVLVLIGVGVAPMMTPDEPVVLILGGVSLLIMIIGVVFGPKFARQAMVETQTPAQGPVLAVLIRASMLEGGGLAGGFAAIFGGPLYLLLPAIAVALLIVLWMRIEDIVAAVLAESGNGPDRGWGGDDR